jgi:hypothetical protein
VAVVTFAFFFFFETFASCPFLLFLVSFVDRMGGELQVQMQDYTYIGNSTNH